MKLKVLPFALALGVICGIGLFVTHMLALYASYGTSWIALIQEVYPYYELTLGGAFLGALYCFIDGFIGGLIFAGLYNLFGFGCCCGRKKK